MPPLMNEWTLGSVPFERGKLDACDLNRHVPGSRHQTIAVQWYGVAMYCSVRTEKGVWEKHASLHQCFVAATNIKYCCLLRRPWPTATVARGPGQQGIPTIWRTSCGSHACQFVRSTQLSKLRRQLEPPGDFSALAMPCYVTGLLPRPSLTNLQGRVAAVCLVVLLDSLFCAEAVALYFTRDSAFGMW